MRTRIIVIISMMNAKSCMSSPNTYNEGLTTMNINNMWLIVNTIKLMSKNFVVEYLLTLKFI
jgi:hypothetical protein